MCTKSHQGIWYFCLVFHILLLKLLSRYEKWGILASHILLSQIPNLKEMQVIHFDQDMQVCGIFINFLILKYFCTPMITTLSLLKRCLLFENMGYLISFFSFLFLHALWHAFFSSHAFWLGHFFLFSPFLA